VGDATQPHTPVDPFFSALRQAITSEMPNRATPAQIYGLLGRTTVKHDSRADNQGNIAVRAGDVVWIR